ncbi:MAG: hypothetical protein KJ063_02335 [Anaerolineae bacterium]|nr:hypothetical protein [Anaerolineae bacterium]
MDKLKFDEGVTENTFLKMLVLLAVQNDVLNRVEEIFDPLAKMVEKDFYESLTELESRLGELGGEKVEDVYEEIESLLAEEKRQLMLTCYLAGVGHLLQMMR